MSRPDAPRIALAPDTSPSWLADAIAEGGGHVVPLADAEAIVWSDARNPAALEEALAAAPGARWVQLPFAGIENFIHLVDDEHVWTCGKGVYAEPVAEMALALGVAGLRGLSHYARADSWTAPIGRNLLGSRVSILGGGGIAESLVRLLQPWDCHITVVRQHVQHMDGVDDVLEADRYADALGGADLVVLALPLTPDTEGLLGRDEFALMERHAWLVNVARGGHVVTDHLVEALEQGVIGGAALDVTDPEPLPPGHRLWSLPNCIITPHVGNTPEMAKPLLAERVTANIRRFAAGDPLIGLVDHEAGY
jgi:phosphoglycerate dehydrogenase-like enzyme